MTSDLIFLLQLYGQLLPFLTLFTPSFSFLLLVACISYFYYYQCVLCQRT